MKCAHLHRKQIHCYSETTSCAHRSTNSCRNKRKELTPAQGHNQHQALPFRFPALRSVSPEHLLPMVYIVILCSLAMAGNDFIWIEKLFCEALVRSHAPISSCSR